ERAEDQLLGRRSVDDRIEGTHAQGSNRAITSNVITRGDLVRSCLAWTISTSLNLPLPLRVSMRSYRAAELEVLPANLSCVRFSSMRVSQRSLGSWSSKASMR